MKFELYQTPKGSFYIKRIKSVKKFLSTKLEIHYLTQSGTWATSNNIVNGLFTTKANAVDTLELNSDYMNHQFNNLIIINVSKFICYL